MNNKQISFELFAPTSNLWGGGTSSRASASFATGECLHSDFDSVLEKNATEHPNYLNATALAWSEASAFTFRGMLGFTKVMADLTISP